MVVDPTAGGVDLEHMRPAVVPQSRVILLVALNVEDDLALFVDGVGARSTEVLTAEVSQFAALVDKAVSGQSPQIRIFRSTTMPVLADDLPFTIGAGSATPVAADRQRRVGQRLAC